MRLVALLVLVLAFPAAPSDCNAIVSMSQGRQVYGGQQFGIPNPSPLEELTGEEWMLLWSGGKLLSWWTIPSNWNTLAESSRCGSDSNIDRVVFVFDPHGSGMQGDNGTTMRLHLNQVLAITAARYPNAVTDLTMLVGANNHVTCPGPVRASKTHAARIGQMLEAGADLDIPCAGYSDTLGHLTDLGAADAQGQLADFYLGG